MKITPTPKIEVGKENKNYVSMSVISQYVDSSTTTPDETYDDFMEERFTFEIDHIYDRHTDKHYDFEETCDLLNQMELKYATLFILFLYWKLYFNVIFI